MVLLTLFIPLIGLSLWGKTLADNISFFMEGDMHPLASRFLMLCFAPLILMFTRRPLEIFLGATILTATYFVFFLSNLRSATLIPLALVGILICSRVIRLKWLIYITVTLLVVIFFFFKALPETKTKLEHEPAYYRVESYPFSLPHSDEKSLFWDWFQSTHRFLFG